MTADSKRPSPDFLPLLIGWVVVVCFIGIDTHTEAALIGLIALLPFSVRGLVAFLPRRLLPGMAGRSNTGVYAADQGIESTMNTDPESGAINTPDAPALFGQWASSLQEVTIQQRGELTRQAQIGKQIGHMADDLNQFTANARRESVRWSAANNQTRATLNAGRESLSAVLVALTETRASSDQNIAALTELARHIRRIGQLIASVNEIATQSNFLALNTAIEAARAESPREISVISAASSSGTAISGPGGASFATVADEMRLLADQSRTAVGQLRAALAEAINALSRAASASEAMVGPLEQASTAAYQLETMFSKLSEALDRSVSAAQQITASTDQQASSLETLMQTTDTVEVLIEQMRAGCQMIDTVAHELTRLDTGR